MQYIWITYLTHEEDDPAETYVEVDDTLMERRRIDTYQNGMAFAYGGEYGQREALSKTPYPANPYGLNQPGEVDARPISRNAFEELWYQMPERPTGFMEAIY